MTQQQLKARQELAALIQRVMQREAREILRRKYPKPNDTLLRHLESALLRTAHQRSHV